MSASYWAPLDEADDRIAAGLELLRARRAADLEDGARHVGWKVGMNDLGVRELLGMKSGVIGYLTDRTRYERDVPPGSGRLGAEVEVAFVVGDEERFAAAHAAIELVDLHELDLTDALARDVWHHGFTLGPAVSWRDDLLDSLTVELRHNGDAIDVPSPGADKLSDLAGMFAFVAGAVEALGARLLPGDVILSGSLAPSIVWLRPGDEVLASIEPLGETSARIG